MRRGMPPHPGIRQPEAKGGRRFPHLADPDYLAFVRDHDCAALAVLHDLTQHEIAAKGLWPCGTWPERSRNEAAHVVGTKGAGNVHDRGSTVSLCPRHHDEQEGRTRRFCERYGVDLYQLAADYLVEYEEMKL